MTFWWLRPLSKLSIKHNNFAMTKCLTKKNWEDKTSMVVVASKGWKRTTVECRNLNVWDPNNAEIRIKQSLDFRRSDFGHSGCLIVQFELLCIGPNKNCLVWTICSDFRHNFFSKIQTKLFEFLMLFKIQTFYNLKIIDCPKTELVRILTFHC